jgi:Na+/H+ antiporter NhaC
MTTPSTGTYIVEVKLTIDGVESSPGERTYKSFAGGASFIPLFVIIFLAATTRMVELSLGFGIFVGCCMVAGSLTSGFREMLAVYIVSALADESHVYVITFILFMAGLVGLIEKAGGLDGITIALQKFVKTTRTAQGTTFFAGLLIFFDDYSNTLVAGASMRPLTDVSIVSREKLAFIVDATSAPIASIMPISSWIGFEIGLIQAELDKIAEKYPDSVLGNTSSFQVFLSTIAYRYYCIYMILFIPFLIATGVSDK